jgi:hypothetical protein
MSPGQRKKRGSTPLAKIRKPMAPPGKIEVDAKKYRRGRTRATVREELEDEIPRIK